ncbi:MAG: hypothetical protein J07HN4v3_02453 [Halonotius sp. J07HN4]|jgi:hypothetical protein|nr:MAG: hypothetical protein J07HN4v3_02453 [Halonotius sp. J07HN4]
MEFTTGITAGLFAAIVALGVGALIVAPMMQASTVLMMVLPSMAVFGLITMAIGVKHGAYRASN